MINKFQKKHKQNKGALLLELLVVISLLAIILTVGANGVFLSMRSNKASGERDVASGLASESIEAVRATTEEDWQNIYGLTKGAHYQVAVSGGKWVLSAGDETINLNNAVYTRYITIDNVSRDNTTRNIESTYSSTDDDPSTQKVTATVSWTGGVPVVMSEYFFRWKNKVCNQTSWTTALPGDTTARTCPDTNYDSISPAGTIDTSSGQLKLH